MCLGRKDDVQLKKLQYGIPYIATIPEQSNIMSIIDKNNENWSWFLNYFIQIMINKNTKYSLDLNFCYGDNYSLLKNIPILDKYFLPRDIVDMKWNICAFIKEAINAGYFVYLSVDEYEIEAYSLYNTKHYNHDLMIVGYNDEKFDIADFFKSQYSVKQCTSKQLEAGYSGYDVKRGNSGFPDIYLLKIKENYTYTFNIDFAKILINEYLEGINSNIHFHPIVNAAILNEDLYAFGINVYSVLKEYIENIEGEKIKIRSFHILCEHKKIILELLNYLGERNYLKNFDSNIGKMEKILYDVIILRNMALKYNVTKKIEIIQRMIAKIDDIRKCETNLFVALRVDICCYPQNFVCENEMCKSVSKNVNYKGEWKKTLNLTMYSNHEDASASYIFKGDVVSIFINASNISRSYNIICDGVIKKYVLNSGEERLSVKFGWYGYHVVIICSTNLNDIELVGIECSTEKRDNVNNYNSCEYIEIDSFTKGNWKIKYGKKGYDIYSYKSKLSSNIKIVYAGFTDKVWNISETNDNGQVLKCDNMNKIAACKYFAETALVDVVIAGDIVHDLTFYVMDCYAFDRCIKIDAVDADSLETVDERIVSIINSGVYVKYRMKGHFIFRFHNLGQAIGVISALFID